MLNPDLYTVFTLKLASQLCAIGFECKKVEPNKFKPWLQVYKFQNTPQLQTAIQAITQS